MSELPPVPWLTGEKVLIVDDNPDIRETLGIIFIMLGAEVKQAGSGEQGLQQWEAWHPTVVLSDIGMENLNGYQFIHAMRQAEKKEGKPHTPAVAVSAYSEDIDRTLAKAAGFDRYIQKPADPIALANLVKELVQR